VIDSTPFLPIHCLPALETEKHAGLRVGGSVAEEWFAGRLSVKPDHVVQCAGCKSNHWTGRVCEQEGCSGKLHDTIISFGDNLRDSVVSAAATAATDAQVVLSLGSTMSVSPANQLVTLGGGKLVTCVRQPTDMDAIAEVVLRADTDSLLAPVRALSSLNPVPTSICA
jgi:NAD-dependent SIR2 family protein deacetylase